MMMERDHIMDNPFIYFILNIINQVLLHIWHYTIYYTVHFILKMNCLYHGEYLQLVGEGIPTPLLTMLPIGTLVTIIAYLFIWPDKLIEIDYEARG